MGIYYGDIHYGIKISKKVEIEGDIFTEPIYEVIFDNNTILLSDYLERIANMYLNLLEPDTYRYELLVDIFTTYNSIQGSKGWQIITPEQMHNFIAGMYKVDFLKIKNSPLQISLIH
jgi:hypothetical protein